MKNTNKKIIFLISGLALLIITMIGITYAYYSVTITGNKSDAVTLTSKAFLITYTDGKTSVTGGNDGTTTTDLIYTKTFTIENKTPTGAYYEVAISDYIVKKDGVDTSFERTEDWTYEIGVVTDTNSDGEITDADEITEILESGTLPTGNESLLSSRYLESETSENLRLVITYDYITAEEGGTDQSADMGKTLSFNVVVNQTDGPNGATGLLADAIIKSAQDNINGTRFVEGSQLGIVENTTIPGQAASLETEAVLTTADDDYTATTGNPSYYYRGNVIDNFVNYANMCWRIIRIDGNSNIKLILADESGPCNGNAYDDMNDLSGFITDADGEYYSNNGAIIYENSRNPQILNEWALKEGLATKDENNNIVYSDLLATSEWCNDTSISFYMYGVITRYDDGSLAVRYQDYEPDDGSEYYKASIHYGFADRWNSPTYKCNMEGLDGSKARKYSSPIGLITADEVLYAGNSASSYLNTNARAQYASLTPASVESSTYEEDVDTSSFVDEYLYTIDTGNTTNLIFEDYAFSQYNVRPAIVLKNTATLDETVLGQNGTQEHPYVIAE